jgi:hypothetical protein
MNKPPYRVPLMSEIAALPHNGYDAISTFSGCGGSSLGYKMAGFRVLYANEFIPAAQETYRANHKGTILDARDIRKVQPQDILDTAQTVERMELMYRMAKLAVETDSTRFVTLYLNPLEVVPKIAGVTQRTHALTHHGNEPEKIAELRRIEEAQMSAFGELLQDFRSVVETGGTLLDRTQILYGSCLGNANSHSTRNLPIVLAGGGFKHGSHLAFDAVNNTPLSNLFLSMLEGLDIEADQFASSTGTLNGLRG